MSGRPLIGVSTSEVRRAGRTHPSPQSEPARRELALGVAYLEAIVRAGGVPVILSPLPPDAIDDLLDGLDGVCLSGGPDIAPDAYGAEPHPELGPTEPELDAFEIDLARRAQQRRLPLLAICRGLQVLNVANGGTLHQHLPDVTDGSVQHRQPEPSEEPTHPLRIARGSRLRRTLGNGGIEVNSFHHQAVERLGSGLRAVAYAPDGVIEGIESIDGEYVLGVQWHAECMADHGRLFRSFVLEAQAGRMPLRRAA